VESNFKFNKKVIDSMYQLTEEGKKYLKVGLPEKRLVELLKEKKKIVVEEARKKIDNFAIALQWSKKNNWIMVVQGEVELLKVPESYPEQEALEKISRGVSIDEKMLSVLINRRLIEKQREDIVKKAEKHIGKDVTNLTTELIKTGLWKSVKLKPYNVSAVGKRIYPGKRQPYNQFLMNVRQKLVGLGFKEMTGPTIETEFWNFDALYQAQNHPSRDWTQTYSLKYPQCGDLPKKEIVEKVKSTHENGWKTGSKGWGYEWNPKKASHLMPRAHDTAISPRYLAKGVEIPGKYFNMVRCYRPDIIDATHGVEFIQTGGFVIGEDLTLRDLLGLLKQFAFEIAGAEKVRFYPDYYPFTEPSVQISARHPKLGWMELAGSGIFREELTKPLGIDVPVIAWGFGLDRLAMYKLRINDIRHMFSRNLEWLRNQKVIM
jgi:phenylalanyl-tRNA synthetase alpha chain